MTFKEEETGLFTSKLHTWEHSVLLKRKPGFIFPGSTLKSCWDRGDCGFPREGTMSTGCAVTHCQALDRPMEMKTLETGCETIKLECRKHEWRKTVSMSPQHNRTHADERIAVTTSPASPAGAEARRISQRGAHAGRALPEERLTFVSSLKVKEGLL